MALRPRCSSSSLLGQPTDLLVRRSVQVNLPAESGEMGVLANHVPSIEQLKPGLVEIIEESGGSKQYFCMLTVIIHLFNKKSAGLRCIQFGSHDVAIAYEDELRMAS